MSKRCGYCMAEINSVTGGHEKTCPMNPEYEFPTSNQGYLQPKNWIYNSSPKPQKDKV